MADEKALFMLTPGGNYAGKLRRMLYRGEIPLRRSTLSHLSIEHDPWCAINHCLPCNCDPDIRYLGGKCLAGDN